MIKKIKAFTNCLGKSLKSRATMQLHERSTFTDIVSGETVSVYKDSYGEFYLANTPWYIFGFRVKTDR